VGHGRAAWLTKVQSPIIASGSCRHLKVSLIRKPRKLHHSLSPAPRGWTKKHRLSSRKQSSKITIPAEICQIANENENIPFFFFLTSGNRDFHITVVDESLGYLI